MDPAVEAAERKKKEQAAAARARRERSRDATGGVGGGASAAQGDLDDGFLAPDENLADAPAVQESDMEEEEEEENNFLGIFLFLKVCVGGGGQGLVPFKRCGGGEGVALLQVRFQPCSHFFFENDDFREFPLFVPRLHATRTRARSTLKTLQCLLFKSARMFARR